MKNNSQQSCKDEQRRAVMDSACGARRTESDETIITNGIPSLAACWYGQHVGRGSRQNEPPRASLQSAVPCAESPVPSEAWPCPSTLQDCRKPAIRTGRGRKEQCCISAACNTEHRELAYAAPSECYTDARPSAVPFTGLTRMSSTHSPASSFPQLGIRTGECQCWG